MSQDGERRRWLSVGGRGGAAGGAPARREAPAPGRDRGRAVPPGPGQGAARPAPGWPARPGPPARRGRAAALGRKEPARGGVVAEAAPAAALDVPQPGPPLQLPRSRSTRQRSLAVATSPSAWRSRAASRASTWPACPRPRATRPAATPPRPRPARPEVAVRRPHPGGGEARGRRARRALAPGGAPPRLGREGQRHRPGRERPVAGVAPGGHGPVVPRMPAT